VSFQTIRTGSGVLGYRPCWCPSPFPSIFRCFPFTFLHLPLNFISVSSLRLMFLHPSVDPSLTHFLGEFSGLGLALVPDVVVPEAKLRCAWSRNLDLNFCPGRGTTLDFGIYRPRTLPLGYRTPPPFSRLLQYAGGYSGTILTLNPQWAYLDTRHKHMQ